MGILQFVHEHASRLGVLVGVAFLGTMLFSTIAYGLTLDHIKERLRLKRD